nr:nitrous oxide reductase maturation protein [uncultured bacterium]
MSIEVKNSGLLVGLFLILSFALHAKEIEICPTCNVNSIQHALDIAKDGDVLRLKKGIYKEGKLIILKQISIIGEDYPILDGEFETEIISIQADNVVIKGLQIQNVGVSFMEDRAGVKIEEKEHCRIEDNRFINTFFAIYLAHSKNCLVKNNYIEGEAKEEATSGNGVHLWYCDSILIEKNEITQHRDGIYIEFSGNSIIIGNDSYNNIRYGLHFMFSDNNLYSENIFRNNNAGVAVMYSNDIIMTNNQFMDNWGSGCYGLLLKEIKDSRLTGNLIKKNTTGIYMEGSNRVVFEGNDLDQNGWAIKIRGNCESNTFFKNNFNSNSFELGTNSKNNLENSFNNNYWSKYTGYDLDKDGYGDISHNPINLFSYIVEKNPTSIILLRSLFIDILDIAEKITPVITPESMLDESPLMKPYDRN